MTKFMRFFQGWEGWDEYAPFYDWENAQTLGRRDVPFWQRVAAETPGTVLGTGLRNWPHFDSVGAKRRAARRHRSIRRDACVARCSGQEGREGREGRDGQVRIPVSFVAIFARCRSRGAALRWCWRRTASSSR